MARLPNKKSSAAKIIFHKAPQTKKQANDHQYVQYSVRGSNGSRSKISAHKSTVRTQLREETTESIDILTATDPSNVQPPIFVDESVDTDIVFDAAYLNHLNETSTSDQEKLERIEQSTGDESLHQFIAQADRYLEELIGVDGRGELAQENCPRCEIRKSEYECRDCLGREMFCAECIVADHHANYLHRILKWNGQWFEKATLKQLGLHVQLGHREGHKCVRPEQVRSDDFVIIDINAVHEVSLNFCGCTNVTQDHISQLLRSRLFPATTEAPKTAVTFRALEYLEILSYESKVSVFEFCQTLVRCTDNSGVDTPKDRYRTVLRLIREWRYLKLMKRAGRGHANGGVAATKEGECAVLCPACPHPGKNMRDGWEDDGRPRYLHGLFIAMDANFRLKRKNISNANADPTLHGGCAYFVEETKYKSHLKDYIHEKEPKSSCSRHDAVNLSEKSSNGHAATGIGACVCSRHDMKRPIAVGDLQRGERYCNMDYLFQSTMKGTQLEYFVVSYDIACQWSINLQKRMEKYDPTSFVHNAKSFIRYLVPKFHLPAHIAKCRANYAFNFTDGTGRTDGEAPERGWIDINGLAASTIEMGPGSRSDTLDCHMGDENWKKVISMGVTMLRKMKAAAKDMAQYTIAHNDLSFGLSPDLISQWEDEIRAWEQDKAQPNPYQITSAGPTQAAVLRQLADDEARDLQSSRDMSLDDTVTPSVLISLGIDLEKEQRRLKSSAGTLWTHALDRQRTKHQYQLNTLQRKIDTWIMYQNLYIPGVVKIRQSFELQRDESSAEIKPYDVPLWLPSDIKNLISTVPANLQRIEWQIRYAQAHEALEVIRAQLQIRAHMFNFKDRFVRGQRPNTRARSTIDGTNAKIEMARKEYNAAYNALCSLAPLIFVEFSWKDELLPLKPEDIRDLSEGRSTRRGKQSEGRRTSSWIWKNVAVDNEDDDGFRTDRFRAEWCKSRARAKRFSEEVALLSEEIFRILRYFEWKSTNWKALGGNDTWPLDTQYQIQGEGRKAYAEKQASMYIRMKKHCEDLWTVLPPYVTRMMNIIDDPSLAKPGEFDEREAKKSKYNYKRT